MTSIDLDIIQDENGKLSVVDQDGRKVGNVLSVDVSQSIESANKITVSFYQKRKGAFVIGRARGVD